MDSSSYATWLVCVLSCAVLAVCGALRVWVRLGTFVLGFLAGIAMASVLASPAWGLTSALASSAFLWRPGWASFAPMVAGFLAAGAGATLAPFSNPASGWALAAIAYVGSLWASQHPGFVSDRMRDEALAMLSLLGLVAGAMPGVAAGWRSAIALNVALAPAPSLSGWVIAAGCTSLALGAVYSIWSRFGRRAR